MKLRVFDQGLSTIERWVGCYVTGVFLLIATFGVFCDIILRKFFAYSIYGLEEIVSFAMMLITFFIFMAYFQGVTQSF